MMSKRLSIFFLAFGMVAFASAKEPALLPPAFNGWETSPRSVKHGTDPAAVDATDFSVLKEYGFNDFETATFIRNGRSMQVKAARFNDVTGAFGAFTFYRQPQMQPEDIGDRGASNNSRVLFYRGNVLVDATLERVTAMSAADLRALADALPRPRGDVSAPPSLPKHLPKQSILPNSERHILGPVALERLGVPIPADLVDFSGKGAEVEFARYRTSDGDASFTLVEYPTPQIAAERLRAWQAASLPDGPFYFRRSGPLLAAVNGSVPQDEAQSLLASVNYDADVTLTQPTRPSPTEDRGAFLVALVLLVLFFLGAALIFGLAFGGFRIIARKLFPNRFDRPEEVEIISLNLRGHR
jgi:hypothetical protein